MPPTAPLPSSMLPVAPPPPSPREYVAPETYRRPMAYERRDQSFDARSRIAKIKLVLKGDLLLFGKVAIPEMFKEKSADIHREWADLLLDKSIKKLLIMAPRDHAKSSIVACLHVLHHLMFDEGPKLVVISSKTGPHAKRLLGTIKNVLDYGQSFQKIFGYWGQMTAKEWSKDQIILKDGSLIIALGTGQQAVGLKEGHQRPTLIVLDDPEDTENTKTADALRFNLRWLLKALVPTLDNKVGQIVVIGTPQCEGCMILKVFKLPGWTAKHYDAIVSEDDQQVLWPEHCSWKFIMDQKKDAEAAGELSIWYSEYRCSIVPDEEQLFKPEYNRYYRGWTETGKNGRSYVYITHIAHTKEGLEAGKLKEIKIVPVNIFMGVDPASSESVRADHSVNFLIAVDKDWNIYCLPYFHKRVTPTAHAEAIVRDYEKYLPMKVTPEATGYQEALRDILRNFSHLWTKDHKRIYIPGLEAKVLPREKKTKRHKTALHIHFFQRQVHLLEGMEAFESELAMWREDKTKVDDLMDGLYLARLKAYRPSHTYDGPQKSSSSGVRKRRYQEDWIYA